MADCGLRKSSYFLIRDGGREVGTRDEDSASIDKETRRWGDKENVKTKYQISNI